MATTNFTTTILVDQTPKEVYEAVNKPRDWWSGEFEGNTTELDDEFTYRYKEFHYSKQKIVELVPNQRVVWLVTESRLNFIEDKQEWTGTKMIFEITEQGDKTKLQFSHINVTTTVPMFGECLSSKAFTN